MDDAGYFLVLIMNKMNTFYILIALRWNSAAVCIVDELPPHSDTVLQLTFV